MANIVTPTNQLRTAEPYQVIASDGIRSLITVLSSSKGVIYKWLHPEGLKGYVDQNTIKLYPFIVIVDYTVILFGDLQNLDSPAISVDLVDETTTNYIYVDYKRDQTNQQPASIVIDTQQYDDKLLIGQWEPTNGLHLYDAFLTVKDDAIEFLSWISVKYKENVDQQLLIGTDDTNVFTIKLKNANQLNIEGFDSDIGLFVNGYKVWHEGNLDVTDIGLPIKTPSIIQPTNGATDFANVIKSSPYETSATFYGPHQASDWEIATDENFTNIIESSYNDTSNLTMYAPSKLETLTTYYVRVRYKSDYHASDWSDPVKFTTPDTFIQTPVISTDSNGSLYPVFTLTEFKTFIYNSQWQSTDWQIATDPNFTNVIYQTTITDPNSANKLAITNDILDVKTTYYVRARYNDNQGHSSNWSSPYEYTTNVYQLEYSIPTQENEQTDVNIYVTHDGGKLFDTSKYVLKGQVTLGTLDISGMTATWHLPDVNQDTVASITLWVERISDGVEVTDRVTKTLVVKNIPITSDDAIAISNFDNYVYNDLWEI